MFRSNVFQTLKQLTHGLRRLLVPRVDLPTNTETQQLVLSGLPLANFVAVGAIISTLVIAEVGFREVSVGIGIAALR